MSRMRTPHHRFANVILLTGSRVSRSGLHLYTSRPSATMRGGRCPEPCAARWPTWRDFEMRGRQPGAAEGVFSGSGTALMGPDVLALNSCARPSAYDHLRPARLGVRRREAIDADLHLGLPRLYQACFLTGKPCGRSRGVVLLFAGLDARRQAVLRRRQRAGGERREGAGGAIGLIEVEDHGAVPRRRRIEEPAGRVGLGSIGLVG